LSEEEEIEILTGRAKRRLDAASHLFKEGFYVNMSLALPMYYMLGGRRY